MKIQLRKTALSLAIAACVGVSGAAIANETTSAIKGQIKGPNGNPAAGTKITILHVPSGSVKTTEVNDAGYFTAKGLRVGASIARSRARYKGRTKNNSGPRKITDTSTSQVTIANQISCSV